MITTTIILAEDHAIVRGSLRSLLARETGLKAIDESENGREAVALAGKFQPDIVVMDFAMPQLNGMQATRQILQKVPPTKEQTRCVMARCEAIEPDEGGVSPHSGCAARCVT